MDKVVLKDLSLFAHHGLFEAEAELGQRFFIDVEVSADLSESQRTDSPRGTVNWKDLVETVTAAFMGRRYDMIEAAADAIAAAILSTFPIARRVRVEVKKPSAPIEAIFAYTSVIVERERRRAS